MKKREETKRKRKKQKKENREKKRKKKFERAAMLHVYMGYPMHTWSRSCNININKSFFIFSPLRLSTHWLDIRHRLRYTLKKSRHHSSLEMCVRSEQEDS